MKYVYTAVFTPEENGMYSVNFPDLQGCYTSGDNMADAIYMAHDVLCLTLYDMEQDNKRIPPASCQRDFKIADNEFTSAVAVDTETYRTFDGSKNVNKTLSIPLWLNERAERENINLSGILQDALKLRLQIFE